MNVIYMARLRTFHHDSQAIEIENTIEAISIQGVIKNTVLKSINENNFQLSSELNSKNSSFIA